VTKIIVIMINVIQTPNKHSMEDVKNAPIALLRVPMAKIVSLFHQAIHVQPVDQERLYPVMESLATSVHNTLELKMVIHSVELTVAILTSTFCWMELAGSVRQVISD
jgi:hypothetical protein